MSKPLIRNGGKPLAWAVALAIGHLAWILAHFAPATMSPDANGYIVQGRLLATAGATYFRTDSPAQFVGAHWLETGAGLFHSRYPAGLPVLYALAWKAGGLSAALLLNPLFASATVLLVFLLARRFADDGSALLAAAVMATNATAQQHALDADSHAAAAFFLTAGILALLRFADKPGVGRGLLAGLLLGIVPTVRYPEAIAGVVVGGWLLWQVRPIARAWPAVVGAALPIGALMLHNASAYGSVWRTGYAITGEQTGFGWGYFAAHALPYMESLGGSGLGLFFAFGLAGLAGMAADPRFRREGVLLAGIAAGLVVLYMAYYFGAGEGNLRFLVPTFPLFAAAGAWLLARIRLALGTAGWAPWATIAALQLTIGVALDVQTVTRTGASLRSAAQVHAFLEQKVPAGSVLVADHQLAESLDASGEWRLVEESLVAGNRMGPDGPPPEATGTKTGQPSPRQADKNQAQHARYDRLLPEDRREQVWEDIRTWAGDRPVFWIASSHNMIEKGLPEGASTTVIGTVDSAAMPMMGPGGPGGGMGPGLGGTRLGIPGAPEAARGFGPGGNGPPFGGRGGPMGASSGRGTAGGALRTERLQLFRVSFAKS